MEKKRYIATVRAKRTIEGIVKEGGLYKLEEHKRRFPYIDFKNPDYFEMVFSDDKFKFGDKVRYIGTSRGIVKNKTLVVQNVFHKISQTGDSVETSYQVTVLAPEDNYERKEWTVSEENIIPANSKWVVSFSQELFTKNHRPAVHEVDHFALQKKFKDTWKQIFVFDTKETAEKVAEMFSCYTMADIYEKTTGRRLNQ